MTAAIKYASHICHQTITTLLKGRANLEAVLRRILTIDPDHYLILRMFLSYFRYQGYTTKPVPSHHEIQKCLVDIGDKPASFVGSKQWIGSTEVMFCLETMLEVQSRIIFANSGQELQSYAPELVHHFQKHGTPIMIGMS